MGCFSYKCKECNEPVNSDSQDGELVRIFLLEGGKVLEEMTGAYNSYGAVYGIDWAKPWREVCALSFDSNQGNGLAYVHLNCFKEVPTTQSERDPNQGWGRMKKKHLTPNPK